MDQADSEVLSERLLAENFPRLQMLLVVSLAGLGAFLCSAVLLRAGLADMATRYFISAVIGYVLFLILIRAWLAYQRRRWSLDFDLIDLPTLGGSGEAPFTGGGGSFGGGGASGSFGAPRVASLGPSPPASSSVGSGALDAVSGGVDEAWLVVLAVAASLAGLVALGFVVYTSPLLFAEVLLDAAVVGAVYRRARGRSRSHWLHGVIRRTWLPALALCVFAAVGGFALQALAPEARSLGAVVRVWLQQ